MCELPDAVQKLVLGVICASRVAELVACVGGGGTRDESGNTHVYLTDVRDCVEVRGGYHCLPHSLSTLYFEMKFLTEPGAHTSGSTTG